ncbi:MAG: hypothetical protein CMQ53_02590 [Gammaproteobacteria bacterium]|jgi:hypothetical protein|nr:hypothetical protein [Gammaproteobacteria bacterium]|tara:strand:+ start:507 stop:746 length:240 start_codon:yes stop_codon:yes gene_type:complete
MEFSPYIIWNIIITLIIAPIFNSIRINAQELKRIDILINKTREEVASKYVTKEELNQDMERVLDRLEILNGKIDKLISG